MNRVEIHTPEVRSLGQKLRQEEAKIGPIWVHKYQYSSRSPRNTTRWWLLQEFTNLL